MLFVRSPLPHAHCQHIEHVVIATLLYFGILWLKQRASRPLIIGIGVIGLCYICAHYFGMYLTSFLFP